MLYQWAMTIASRPPPPSHGDQVASAGHQSLVCHAEHKAIVTVEIPLIAICVLTVTPSSAKLRAHYSGRKQRLFYSSQAGRTIRSLAERKLKSVNRNRTSEKRRFAFLEF